MCHLDRPARDRGRPHPHAVDNPQCTTKPRIPSTAREAADLPGRDEMQGRKLRPLKCRARCSPKDRRQRIRGSLPRTLVQPCT
jgi:hypothetical protein